MLKISDSQAALKALLSNEIKSNVVMDCITSLKALGIHNKLIICWIPDNEGHSGHKKADCLASRDAPLALVSPEPFFGIPADYPGNLFRNDII